MPTRPLVFVVLPFDEEFDNVYFGIRSVADGLGAVAERADDPLETKRITERILRMIERADLVIADITLPRPNVFYEVGYAHAIWKPVFFIAQSLEAIPFDVKDYPVVAYGKPIILRPFVDNLLPKIKLALEKATSSSRLREPIAQMLGNIEEVNPKDDLYAKIVEDSLKAEAAKTHQWATGTVRVGPSEAIEKGIQVFRNLRTGGLATYLVPIDNYWSNNTEYLEECRRAARAGANIERVFILSDFDSLHNSSLLAHIQHDRSAGIRTSIVFADRVLNKNAVRDFGIWDDQVLCLIDTVNIRGELVASGCTFTKNAAELRTAELWRESILAVAQPAPEVLEQVEQLKEAQAMLYQSAPLMAKLANRLCKGDVVDRQDCSWYHSAWQYLRVLDMVSTPDWHIPFFSDSIERIFKEEQPARALICGAADYAMLHHLASAVPNERLADLEIFVLDLCATPLQMCEWYAQQKKLSVQVVQQNALDMHVFREGAFDLIVTDAFITRFDPGERVSLMKEWLRVLRPGGYVVTTCRLDNSAQKAVASPRDVDLFVERARASAQRDRWIPLAADQIIPYARAYAENMVSYPVTDSKTLESLFNENGFGVEKLEARLAKGEFRNTTMYARIVARKLTAVV